MSSKSSSIVHVLGLDFGVFKVGDHVSGKAIVASGTTKVGDKQVGDVSAVTPTVVTVKWSNGVIEQVPTAEAAKRFGHAGKHTNLPLWLEVGGGVAGAGLLGWLGWHFLRGKKGRR